MLNKVLILSGDIQVDETLWGHLSDKVHYETGENLTIH